MLCLPITTFLGQFPQNSVICLIIHLIRQDPQVPETTEVREAVSIAPGSNTII